MAILGGLVTALGCLFTSFATQFHQLFFAFGIFIGIGIAMIREPSVVMIGQYFKKRRETVEIGLMTIYSLGISFMPLFITFCIRFVSKTDLCFLLFLLLKSNPFFGTFLNPK
jgi:MFS family permease